MICTLFGHRFSRRETVAEFATMSRVSYDRCLRCTTPRPTV
jgi:hypothetical protein